MLRCTSFDVTQIAINSKQIYETIILFYLFEKLIRPTGGRSEISLQSNQSSSRLGSDPMVSGWSCDRCNDTTVKWNKTVEYMSQSRDMFANNGKETNQMFMVTDVWIDPNIELKWLYGD